MRLRKISTVALVTLGVAIIGTAAATAHSDHAAAATFGASCAIAARPATSSLVSTRSMSSRIFTHWPILAIPRMNPP